MNSDIILGLQSTATPYQQSKALEFFEQAKKTDEGVHIAAHALANSTYKEDTVNFFLWQILEFQIKRRHSELTEELRVGLRNVLITWLQNYCHKNHQDPVYLRNKAAQVFALIFAKEYLSYWPSFPQDIFQAVGGNTSGITNANGLDIYLRILNSIDSEVIDRSIEKNPEVQCQYQLIKDTMRDHCVVHLVDCWYLILVNNQTSAQSLELCLKIVGRYIEWIDVNLIVNDEFMTLILEYVKSPHEDVREAACDCLIGICAKGMPSENKLNLINQIWQALTSVFENAAHISDEDQIDYIIKLSRLASSMVSNLVEAYHKCEKGSDLQFHLLDSIHSKVSILLPFFANSDDDVSVQCVDSFRSFLEVEKKNPKINEELLSEILYAVIAKLKYDTDYNFINEGEEEADFDQFVKSVKVIFDNLAALVPELVFNTVAHILSKTLSQWQEISFAEVEVAIRIMYYLGESMTSNLSHFFSTEYKQGPLMCQMMNQLVLSEVVSHEHVSVRMQFFETVTRYDRYFPAVHSRLDRPQQQTLIINSIKPFLDHRGMRSDNLKIRSRCAYLFSKFAKTLGKLLNPFSQEVLTQVGQLLVLSSDNSVDQFFSPTDQMFLYELCGHIIVNLDPANTVQLVTELLLPLVQGFDKHLQMLATNMPVNCDPEESLPHAKVLNYAMIYASRSSKAFTCKRTMQMCGCSDIYKDTLQHFMSVLTIQHHRDLLNSGFRQYMHRMVMCLEEEVLPFVPLIIKQLLESQHPESLLDFIPFMMQIISKFKNKIGPFLHEIFMPVVQCVFQVLTQQQNNNCNSNYHEDEDMKSTKRTYFNLLHSLLTSDLAQVIINQSEENFLLIISTLVQGAEEFSDSLSRKVVFNNMLKLVEALGDEERNWRICSEHFIPVCFRAPLSSNFDLNDAQTILALNESCNLMKKIHSKQGEKMEVFLKQRLLPSLNLNIQLIDDYCYALGKTDQKTFRKYVKNLFCQLKT